MSNLNSNRDIDLFHIQHKIMKREKVILQKSKLNRDTPLNSNDIVITLNAHNATLIFMHKTVDDWQYRVDFIVI